MPNGQFIAAELLNAFQLGEEKAFDFFFRKYFASLSLFANKYLDNLDDAEDLVQECFMKLWARHTTIRNVMAIKTYLYTSVRNACLDKIKHRAKEKNNLEGFVYLGDSFDAAEINSVVQAELAGNVMEAIEALPQRIQQVVRKFYLEGKSQEEIAAEFSTSNITVRNQRLRGLQLLKEKLSTFVFILSCLFL